MKVYLRGIPDFGHVVTHEVDNLDDFLSLLELRVYVDHCREIRADHFLNKKRVMLYVQDSDFREMFKSKPRFSIRIDSDGRLVSSGTACNDGDLFFVGPETDPRCPEECKNAWDNFKERMRQARIEEEREERLRGEVLSLAYDIGLEKAITLLSGSNRPMTPLSAILDKVKRDKPTLARFDDVILDALKESMR